MKTGGPAPMTIAHLITSLEGGGTENFLFQILAHSPADFRHEVFFLKKDGVLGERIRALGIPVKRTGCLYAVWKALRALRPRVLNTYLYRAHQIGRILGRWAGVPVIISHQRSIDAWQGFFTARLDAWTLRWCDQVWVNSDAARHLVEDRLPEGASRPTLLKIPNGLDPVQFTRRDTRASRRSLGLPEDVLLGGSLLRLHPEKGADLLPAYARAILSSTPSLHLAIAGVGPLESSLRKALPKPWADRLHWLGWVEDKGLLLSALDFFFLLSREESSPQALLEAAAMGLPWVSADVGGVGELSGDLAGGLLFQPGQVADAVAKTETLLEKMSHFRTLAQTRAPTLRALHSLSSMTETIYAHWRQVGAPR